MKCLLYLMSIMITGASVLLIFEIWKNERCLAYRLGLTAMVLGMACAGVFAFYLAMAL